MMRLPVLTLLIMACHALHGFAQQPRPLEYTVSFTDRASHYIQVELLVPAPPTEQLELMMPTWTPGSYLIREYSRHVDQISAKNADGAPAMIEKTLKNRWRLKCVPGQDVVVSYRLYCREMSVRSNWVDQDMAVLTGAATFLTVADAKTMMHQVRFVMPDDWARSMTALKSVSGREHTYLAESIDELVDSPVLCGNPVIQDFAVGGVSHTLATLGDSSLWDTAKAAADVQRIVAAQQEFWGQIPYPHYKFLNVIAETGGGLEHDNSTLVMTSRWNFRDKEKYEDWLSLISHEFFHTWNVRRVRPVSLVDYNYDSENNTRSLWIAEGLTSYYEDLFLVRSGLIDQAAYLKRLSSVIEKLQTTPGRKVQSLAESSFDTWIKFYRPDENSSNTRVSYYVKGCVVGFLLDIQIRELTGDARSLDDVMRLLYQRHSGGKGYSDAEFAAIVSEVAGTDMTSWLSRYLETTDELDYTPALNWLGLQFPPGEKPATAAANVPQESTGTNAADSAQSGTSGQASAKDAAGDSAAKSGRSSAWLGVQVSESGTSPVVTGVIHGSPAQIAGVNVDDELLAFNQYRASSKNWRNQLTQLGIEKPIQVLVSRRGEIRTLEILLTEEPRQKWTLKPVDKPADEATKRLQKWLGLSTPPVAR